MKLFDSEWKVMEVLWQENDRTAKEISLRLADSIANSIPSTTGFFFVAKVHLQIRGTCSMDRENAAQCHLVPSGRGAPQGHRTCH